MSRLYLLSLNTADPECLLCPEEEEEEEEVVEEEEVEEEEEFVDEMTEEVEGSCAYANTVCMSKKVKMLKLLFAKSGPAVEAAAFLIE